MRTLGGGGFDELFDLVRNSSGGYALSGTSNSFGTGSTELILATLSSEFGYCGGLIYEDSTINIVDVTSHSDMLQTDSSFQFGLSTTTFTVHSVTPANSDFMTQLTDNNGKQMCDLVGAA